MTARLDLLSRPGSTDPARPRNRAAAVVLSLAAGLALAILWSFELVDHEIGDTVANNLLGHDAKQTAIVGTAAGLLFAFVSGLAGTFTACNIAMAAAVGPLTSAGAATSRGGRGVLRMLVRPTACLLLGMVAVSAVYGFVGVLIGDRLPQLSTDTAGGMPVRIIQSSVVFGVIGLALLYLGLAALGVLPDVFRDRPTARVVALGGLIGGFLIGRPYPLFNKLFHYAADTHNPLYGSLAFVLQSLGNVTLVVVLFVLVTLLTRGRVVAWLAGSPRRAALVSGVLLIALGAFTVAYWDLRVPALFGHGWFPTMPYNA
ncbi:hypothetical protein ACQP00_31455 [Dactylosporangium sp. CS-047395]|uniref:hypothetical protein n=1 Tax=Dactylosporangium sp. CS-047395 TaxID=3239936 RepID=UPI003D8B9894